MIFKKEGYGPEGNFPRGEDVNFEAPNDSPPQTPGDQDGSAPVPEEKLTPENVQDLNDLRHRLMVGKPGNSDDTNAITAITERLRAADPRILDDPEIQEAVKDRIDRSYKAFSRGMEGVEFKDIIGGLVSSGLISEEQAHKIMIEQIVNKYAKIDLYTVLTRAGELGLSEEELKSPEMSQSIEEGLAFMIIYGVLRENDFNDFVRKFEIGDDQISRAVNIAIKRLQDGENQEGQPDDDEKIKKSRLFIQIQHLKRRFGHIGHIGID